MYFVRKAHVFSLLHVYFYVCHYLMILCHFDQMNDRIMFFLSIDYVRFIHHLDVLIVYD